MKVQSAVLLRRKYVNYMFELASFHFKDLNGLLDAHEQVEACKKKDSELQAAKKRLLGLQDSIKADSEGIESMAQYNAKAMKETTNIKQNLSKKININKKEIEENYAELNDLYQGIVLHNSSIMINKLRENEIFKKMQLAIDKTDDNFINFCKNFKLEELSKLEDMDLQLKRLLSYQKELSEDIDTFNIKQMELKINPIDMGLKMSVKNLKLKIINHCSTLDHYNETYKKDYAESLKFRISDIKSLKEYFATEEEEQEDSKSDLKFFSNVKNVNLNVNVLNEINKHIHKMMTIYESINESNLKNLEKVKTERERILKAAISLNELTVKASRQWLELDEKGWFAQTKKYLLEHELSSSLMIPNLMD